jgi:hypothetical protein
VTAKIKSDMIMGVSSGKLEIGEPPLKLNIKLINLFYKMYDNVELFVFKRLKQ